MIKQKGVGLAGDISAAVKEVTKAWTKTIKSEERAPAMRQHRYSRMIRERRTFIKEAAWEIMEEAYNKVSSNGALPANARQIMYAARPHILETADVPA